MNVILISFIGVAAQIVLSLVISKRVAQKTVKAAVNQHKKKDTAQ